MLPEANPAKASWGFKLKIGKNGSVSWHAVLRLRLRAALRHVLLPQDLSNPALLVTASLGRCRNDFRLYAPDYRKVSDCLPASLSQRTDVQHCSCRLSCFHSPKGEKMVCKLNKGL
eukprot:6210747-Pleurochrysis_carterae.AAC.1